MANENVTFTELTRLLPPIEIFDGSTTVPDVKLSDLKLVNAHDDNEYAMRVEFGPFDYGANTSYPTFNKMSKSAVIEVCNHIGVNPMYTPAIIPNNMFFDVDITYSGVDPIYSIQKFVEFMYNVILKDVVKSAIEYAANVMPGMFMNIPDVLLANYDYNWDFKLEYGTFMKKIAPSIDSEYDDIAINMGLNNVCYSNFKANEIKRIEEILGNAYKNLIRYGFEVVKDIKKRLNEGNNGYMPDEMLITRNPGMQYNGRTVTVPITPVNVQPMGPEDVAVNPDDRFKDPVFQPFVTQMGSAPMCTANVDQNGQVSNIQEQVPGQMTMGAEQSQQQNPIQVRGVPVSSPADFLEDIKKQYYKEIADITANINNLSDEQVIEKMTEVRKRYYETYGLTPEFLDGNVTVKPEEGTTEDKKDVSDSFRQLYEQSRNMFRNVVKAPQPIQVLESDKISERIIHMMA